MIKLENLEWSGLETAIRGMRNPMNSWDRSDSDFENDILGPNDAKLMEQLAKGGPVHAKYCRLGYYGSFILVEGVRHVQGRCLLQLLFHHA